MTHNRAIGLVMAVLSLAGCGKKAADVTGPPPVPPPVVATVSPAPQSVAIPVIDPEIWAEFREPLDPATVNDRTVYLKIDDGRIPITVSYDAPSRRIVVQPVEVLQRLKTYTVEISTQVRTTSGGGLERTWFWQFTTLAIRPPVAPGPASGAIDQSKFTWLRWSGNADSPGGARFELFFGVDSAAVATHTVTPISTGQQDYYLPRERWPNGTTVYWSVRAISLVTGETVDSPVWRFSTLDATGALVETITLAPAEAGYQSIPNRNQRSCTQTFFTSGPLWWCGIRWNVGLLPENMRIAEARIVLGTAPSSEFQAPGGTTLWAATVGFSSCSLLEAPPRFDETLGSLAAARSVSSGVVELRSDLLCSHLEAMRGNTGLLFGYFLRSSNDVNWASNTATDTSRRPRLVVSYYP